MGESNSFQLRRAYVWFCCECVGRMSKLYFEENFY